MMEKLELKHIAPYLPYNLKFLNQHLPDESFVVEELVGISNHITWSGVFNAKHGNNHTPICAIKPILRPLSDLTKEISNGVGLFYPFEELNLCYSDVTNFLNEDLWIGQWWDYDKVSKLIEWHFDVFGLIEKGLAIDANEL